MKNPKTTDAKRVKGQKTENSPIATIVIRFSSSLAYKLNFLLNLLARNISRKNAATTAIK